MESAGHIPLAAVLLLHLALRHIGGWTQGCGLEQWTGTLGQGARWSEPTPPQVGSGSNPLSRTHFPSGFAWVRGSGFAKQVGSQWVRAKVANWPCGFAVGSRPSGFAKVGSSGFANVGSRKVGSRGNVSGFAVGSRKQWVRSGFAKTVGSRETVSGETGFANSGFAGGFAWNPLVGSEWVRAT